MTKTALIIIDLQNDFLKGGTLEAKDGNAIIPIMNQLLNCPFDVKVASKDWHPKDHLSFTDWPVHCVQDTFGAEFPKELNSEKIEKVFYKGMRQDIDSYSAFFDNERIESTGLYDYLKEAGVNEVYIGGLVTDFCVKASVLDALKLKFKTHVIVDASRAAFDHESAIEEMEKAGAVITHSKDIF